MQDIYIIIDIGTGNMRVGAFTMNGRMLCLKTRDTIYHRDLSYTDSTVFYPKEWMQNIIDLIKQIMEEIGNDVHVLAVSSTSQREGIVLIDKEGKAFLGLPNIDNRGADYPLRSADYDFICSSTGFEPIPSFTAPKLYATMKRQLEIMERLWKFLFISDWIAYEMCGEIVCEHSQAMHTLTYDYRHAAWDQDLERVFGFKSEWYPELVWNKTIIGAVRQKLVGELHLCENTKFVVGGSDSQLALIGVEAVPGDIVIISGTTTPIEMLCEEPPKKKGGWLNPHALPGQYMLEINAAYTGINYQRFKSIFFPEKSYEELEDEALQRGFPSMFSMTCMGISLPQTPVNKAGFMFDNPIPFDINGNDFMHALALDISCGIHLNLEYLNQLSSLSCRNIIGCGGGFQGKLIPRYISGLEKKEIIIYENYKQASLMGCARTCNEAFGIPQFPKKVLRVIKSEEDRRLEEYYD